MAKLEIGARKLAALLVVPGTVGLCAFAWWSHPMSRVNSAAADGLPELRLVAELRRDHPGGWPDFFAVTWSSDAKQLAAYSEWSNAVTVWNANGGMVQDFLRYGDNSVDPHLGLREP